MKCPHCPKEFNSEESLKGHINGLHWKLEHPLRHGKPSKKKVNNK